jgi:hypothetical protein
VVVSDFGASAAVLKQAISGQVGAVAPGAALAARNAAFSSSSFLIVWNSRAVDNCKK